MRKLIFTKDTFRFEIQDLKGKYGACGKEVVLQFNKMHSIIIKNVFHSNVMVNLDKL